MLLVEEKVYKEKKLFKAIDNMCFKGKTYIMLVII